MSLAYLPDLFYMQIFTLTANTKLMFFEGAIFL